MLQKDVPKKLSTAVKKPKLKCVKLTRKRASGADANEEMPKHMAKESLEGF